MPPVEIEARLAIRVHIYGWMVERYRKLGFYSPTSCPIGQRALDLLVAYPHELEEGLLHDWRRSSSALVELEESCKRTMQDYEAAT